MERAYVSVHIIDISYHIDRPYSYFLPPALREGLRVGSIVVVPFGNANKQVSAVVTGFSDSCAYAPVKPVQAVLDYPLPVPEELCAVCLFMKERFFCTFGSAFRTVLPPGVNLGTEVYYTAAPEAAPEALNAPAEALFRFVRTAREATRSRLFEEFGPECAPLLDALAEKGILVRHSRVPKKINEKNVRRVCLAVEAEEARALLEAPGGLTPKQRVLLELLLHYPCSTVRELEAVGGVSAAVVGTLVKKGVAAYVAQREERAPAPAGPSPERTAFTLSAQQRAAADALAALHARGKAQAALLYGVTGSGKTKVIITAVQHILEQGRTAIILLPEIGLTAQAQETYRAEFGERLAIIHSMLSVGERIDTYRKIAAGGADVVLGTRSAVFAPLSRIGIIVVDEEQEATYKSELTPKYHARDIARFRCAKNDALLLLASATPSVESFYKAQNGVYTLLKLDERYGDSVLPEVEIVDLRGDASTFPDRLIGTRLREALLETKAEGGQSILLVNRRGYNSHLSCRSCGRVFTCPQCSVSLTYHAYSGAVRDAGRLTCHYCGYTMPVPQTCDICGGGHIGFFGFGTQKLQDELEQTLPELTCLRMDADTTGTKHAHSEILEAFGAGKADVLFGTQMISKGLDFPRVRLVGVVSVDSSLYMEDFRAGERTFSLITQLVGRAGRAGPGGRAILQTYNPDNEILRLAAAQDYERFYATEILLRQAVAFPPFCAVAVFGFSSQSEEECAAGARTFDALLVKLHESSWRDVKLRRFGPHPNAVYKVGGRFRQRMIVKYSDNARTRAFFAELYAAGLSKLPRTVRLELDVHPAMV